MKLSELFFAKTKELWDEAANKPFVIEMAKGTLDADLFKRYMLQDYLYLKDYIGILINIRDMAEDENTRAFLKRIIDGTVDETERVHVANMKELGITADDIAKSVKFPVINAYVEYMRECTDRYGLTGGITSLLQCSWVYAYIAEKVLKRFPDEIGKSSYGSWFEAYSCQSYLDTNQLWIELLDELGSGIDEKTSDEMCLIFEKCACYENEFWDALYA